MSLKFILLIGAVCLFFTLACQKENMEGVKFESFSTPFNLGLFEKSIISNKVNKLTVKVENISDSRCVTQNNCPQSGNALVRLTVSDLKNARVETNLCIGECDRDFKTIDSTSITLNQIKYTLLLNRVSFLLINGLKEKQMAELIIKMNAQ